MGRTLERFWASVEKTDTCWPWRGHRLPSGYGAFRCTFTDLRYSTISQRILAHRFSWMHENGPIPPGLFVLHHCDNPPCVNPDHLFLGTLLDNKRDSMAKRRHARGETNGGAVATEGLVRAIRTMHASGKTTRAIATETGLSKSTVWAIASRLTWREVQ